MTGWQLQSPWGLDGLAVWDPVHGGMWRCLCWPCVTAEQISPDEGDPCNSGRCDRCGDGYRRDDDDDE